MRMLNATQQSPVDVLQLYLTPHEAGELRRALDRLLVDPDANEHEHVVADDGRDLSVSIVTPAKLRSVDRDTAVERQLLRGS